MCAEKNCGFTLANARDPDSHMSHYSAAWGRVSCTRPSDRTKCILWPMGAQGPMAARKASYGRWGTRPIGRTKCILWPMGAQGPVAARKASCGRWGYKAQWSHKMHLVADGGTRPNGRTKCISWPMGAHGPATAQRASQGRCVFDHDNATKKKH